ncbi:MAG: glycosyltransferase family 2 protein [Pseudomonadota bacterium]
MEALFWGSVLLIGYVYVGYPLLMWCWARWAGRPVRPQDWEPSVAIVVVAHNEKARIEEKLRSCMAQDYPASRLRVVIASDGSDDGMNEWLRARGCRAVVQGGGEELHGAHRAPQGAAEPEVVLLAFPERRGKAACLNDAVMWCDEEVIVFTDARQRLNPQAVRSLVRTLGDRTVGAVSGELMFTQEESSTFSQSVGAYWRYEKFVRRQEAAVHSSVGVTGALYAIRRELYRPIPPQTILDDVAIPMAIAAQGARVVFEPAARAYDLPSKEPEQERRRKVRTLAGNFQLMAMNPGLLLPWRNPLWLQFVSHKAARLFVPPVLAGLLAANIALAMNSTFYAGLLLAHLGAYAAGTLGPRSGLASQWRIVKLARAFLFMNWCVMLGAREFFANRHGHLWQVTRTAAAGGEAAAAGASTGPVDERSDRGQCGGSA